MARDGKDSFETRSNYRNRSIEITAVTQRREVERRNSGVGLTWGSGHHSQEPLVSGAPRGSILGIKNKISRNAMGCNKPAESRTSE